MKKIQRCKNETNMFDTYWIIEMRNKKQNERYHIIFTFDNYKFLSNNNSIRYERICFIVEALKFFHWKLQHNLIEFILYDKMCACVQKF